MSAVYPPPAPTPQPSMMDYVKSFLTGGLTGAAQTGGMQMPGWSNAISSFLQKPEVNAALGVMTPIKGAGVRMGIPEAADMQPAANARPFTPGNPAQGSIDKYFNALALNKITPQEFHGFMETLGVDKSLIPDMASSAQRHGTELRQSVREQIKEIFFPGSEERAKESRSKFRVVKDKE